MLQQILSMIAQDLTSRLAQSFGPSRFGFVLIMAEYDPSQSGAMSCQLATNLAPETCMGLLASAMQGPQGATEAHILAEGQVPPEVVGVDVDAEDEDGEFEVVGLDVDDEDEDEPTEPTRH